MRRKLGILCVLLGGVLLVAALGLVLYNTWESRSAQDASSGILSQIREVQDRIDTPGVDENPYADHVDKFDETAKEMTVKMIDGHGYIGSLSIPVLELELPVMSQWDYDRLKIAPCRQCGSTKTDDLVVAAHNYVSHFGRLSQLQTGDLLTFTDMDAQTILYSVEALDILQPTDVNAVKNSGFDLVLYTCTYGGENRVVVFCNRVKT